MRLAESANPMPLQFCVSCARRAPPPWSLRPNPGAIVDGPGSPKRPLDAKAVCARRGRFVTPGGLGEESVRGRWCSIRSPHRPGKIAAAPGEHKRIVERLLAGISSSPAEACERWDVAQALAERSAARWAAEMADRREAECRAAAAGALQRCARGRLGRREAAAVRSARDAADAGRAGTNEGHLLAAEALPVKTGKSCKDQVREEDTTAVDALLDDAMRLAAREVCVAVVPFVAAGTAEFGTEDALKSALCRLEAAAHVAMGGLDSPMKVASACVGDWVVRFLTGDWVTVAWRVEDRLGGKDAG
ncbi:unnamed protein product [Prorocentrum cordatum]|uniref:Uncharacterized protein n=1 Tax=Prorocentrum cordatum TaxID=2364126 RepID=A0ABN9TIS3_9DINO|nr:unnamed protein product [Polarella glacialis]